MEKKEYYKMLGEDLVPYIVAKGGKVTQKNLNYQFGCGNMTVNDIPSEDLEFVDGYAQVISDSYQIKREGWIDTCYTYNYITEDGKTVFEDDFRNAVAYIGRNIFINMNEEDRWYICSPTKERKLVNINNIGRCIPNNQFDKFVNCIITELNRKYTLESNGCKYSPSAKEANEWIINDICGMEFDVKKMVLEFVDAISAYDHMFRSVYSFTPMQKEEDPIEKSLKR